MNPSTPTQTIIWLLGLIACALFFLWLDKKPKPPARDEQRIRRHRRIQERQLGEAYRDDGFTLWQTLYAITLLGCVLTFVPTICFILHTVMGMDEPRW